MSTEDKWVSATQGLERDQLSKVIETPPCTELALPIFPPPSSTSISQIRSSLSSQQVEPVSAFCSPSTASLRSHNALQSVAAEDSSSSIAVSRGHLVLESKRDSQSATAPFYFDSSVNPPSGLSSSVLGRIHDLPDAFSSRSPSRPVFISSTAFPPQGRLPIRGYSSVAFSVSDESIPGVSKDIPPHNISSSILSDLSSSLPSFSSSSFLCSSTTPRFQPSTHLKREMSSSTHSDPLFLSSTSRNEQPSSTGPRSSKRTSMALLPESLPFSELLGTSSKHRMRFDSSANSSDELHSLDGEDFPVDMWSSSCVFPVTKPVHERSSISVVESSQVDARPLALIAPWMRRPVDKRILYHPKKFKLFLSYQEKKLDELRALITQHAPSLTLSSASPFHSVDVSEKSFLEDMADLLQWEDSPFPLLSSS